MAKKAVSTTGQPAIPAEYRYIGPAYNSAVWLCGRRFVPHDMTQEEIALALSALPALARYFTLTDPVAHTDDAQEEPPTPPPAEEEAAPEEV